MAYFESLILLNPTKEEKGLKSKIRAYEWYIQTFSKTKEVTTEDMGEKILAYGIKKHKTARYVRFRYQAKPINIESLERKFRTDDDVLRFLTVQASDDGSDFELEDLSPKVNKYKDIDALDVLLGRVKI